MIDNSTIQRVLDATDIVDVVKEFVTLRKAGVNYKGLCPFHNEKTPSFTVSPSKQLCKCFSCGVGGNAVNFLMKLEQMTYPEAIKWLGKKYNIEVVDKEITDEQKALQSERESLFALNEWANQYFQDKLHNHVDGIAKGLSYFRSRGFRDDIIRKFCLGYSLEDRKAMTQAALAHGFKADFLIKTGLSYQTENGEMFDRYHGRVIFPVYTVSGKIVAFGGRILNSSNKKLAKYVNSPESDIYSKSHQLYGLYQAKSAIVRQGCCFLVEGYTDVISMHQSGIENVVASSGTSLTEGQIRLLHRFTNNITILYDGDAAGIKASLRGIDMLLSEGLHIKVLLLPDGEDPDSFAKQHNQQEFQAYIEEHQVDFIKFKTDLLLDTAVKDPIKKAEVITDIVKSIAVIPDQIVRQMYISECAAKMAVTEDLIINEINKLKNKQAYDTQKSGQTAEANSTPDSSTPIPALRLQQSETLEEEKLLMAMIIRYGNCIIGAPSDQTTTTEAGGIRVTEFVQQDFQQDGITFSTPLYQEIFAEAVQLYQSDVTKDTFTFFLNHPNAQINALAAELGSDGFVLSTNQRKQFKEEKDHLPEIVPRLLLDYKHAILRTRLNSITQQLRNPELMNDPVKYREIMKQYMELSMIERKLSQLLGDRVVLRSRV